MLYFENYIIKNKFYYIIYLRNIFLFFKLFSFFQSRFNFISSIMDFCLKHNIYVFKLSSKYFKNIIQMPEIVFKCKFLVISSDNFSWLKNFKDVHSDIFSSLCIILFRDRLLNISFFSSFSFLYDNKNLYFIFVRYFYFYIIYLLNILYIFLFNLI